MIYHSIITGILIILFIVFCISVYISEKPKQNKKIKTRSIVRVGIFSAFSAILYIFIKFPLPMVFPGFLEFHFDEVPAFIASFAYGPISGFAVIVIKTLIKLPLTSTMGVGELSDLIYSSAFIIPASIIYKKHRNFKGVAIGLAIGSVLQMIVAVVSNIYIMIPFYMTMMGLPESVILAMCSAANSNITNLGWAYGLIGVLPFNLVKNAAVIILTLISYKSVHRFIDKIN